MRREHPNIQRVAQAAAAGGVEIRVERFPAGTRTAAQAAEAVGCALGAIVKSIVLMSDRGPLVVLTSGANRVDYAKIEAALACGGVRRANADEAREATGFPIGGTAPLGHPAPLPMLLDRDLLRHDEVWAAAGTPDTVFPLPPNELRVLTGAAVVDVAEA